MTTIMTPDYDAFINDKIKIDFAKMYKVTYYRGHKRYKDRSLFLREDALYDDKQLIVKYVDLRQIIIGKRDGRRTRRSSLIDRFSFIG